MQLPLSFTTVTRLSKTLAVLLFVALPFAGFYFGTRYQSTTLISQPTILVLPTPSTVPVIAQTSGWNLPVSTDTGIPVVKDGVLNWYSLSTKQLKTTRYKTSWGSGASGLGEDNPLPSPNGKLIAFINKSDNNSLYLLPVGTDLAIKVTTYPVEFINSWSSDSSQILFNNKIDNLNIRKQSEGMGDNPPWDPPEQFIQNALPGLHVFKVATGQDISLYPLSTVDKFVDSHRVVVETRTPVDDKSTRLVLFDVNNFSADYSTVNFPSKSFSTHKTFSADATYWARTVDDGNTSSGVKIVFSKFPLDAGDTVDTAPWAFIQRPLLNPSGKFLAYAKHGDQIKDGKFAGQYPDRTIIWDTTTKKVIKDLPGWPEYWVNENTILVGRAEYGSNLTSFSSLDLFHLDTQVAESITLK